MRAIPASCPPIREERDMSIVVLIAALVVSVLVAIGFVFGPDTAMIVFGVGALLFLAVRFLRLVLLGRGMSR